MATKSKLYYYKHVRGTYENKIGSIYLLENI